MGENRRTVVALVVYVGEPPDSRAHNNVGKPKGGLLVYHLGNLGDTNGRCYYSSFDLLVSVFLSSFRSLGQGVTTSQREHNILMFLVSQTSS